MHRWFCVREIALVMGIIRFVLRFDLFSPSNKRLELANLVGYCGGREIS